MKCAVTSLGGPKPEVYWRKIRHQGRRDGGGGGADEKSGGVDGVVAAWMREQRRRQNQASGGGSEGGVSTAAAAAAVAAAASAATTGTKNAAAETDANVENDSRFGELWFAGNLSYSTFNFQVRILVYRGTDKFAGFCET